MLDETVDSNNMLDYAASYIEKKPCAVCGQQKENGCLSVFVPYKQTNSIIVVKTIFISICSDCSSDDEIMNSVRNHVVEFEKETIKKDEITNIINQTKNLLYNQN